MVEHYGSQCGYCTPGFVVSLFEAYYRDGCREPGQISDQLCGNLCRCTGYRPIRDAAVAALAQRNHVGSALAPTSAAKTGKRTRGRRKHRPYSRSICRPPPGTHHPAAGPRLRGGERQIPAPGLTRRPLRATGGEPRRATRGRRDRNRRRAEQEVQKFSLLISTEAVPELTQITKTDAAWRIGAAATLTNIEEAVAGEYPSLAKMLRVFASRQIAIAPRWAAISSRPRPSATARRRSSRSTRAWCWPRRRASAPCRCPNSSSPIARPCCSGRNHARGDPPARRPGRRAHAPGGFPQGVEAARTRHQHRGRGVSRRRRCERDRARSAPGLRRRGGDAFARDADRGGAGRKEARRSGRDRRPARHVQAHRRCARRRRVPAQPDRRPVGEVRLGGAEPGAGRRSRLWPRPQVARRGRLARADARERRRPCDRPRALRR